MSGPGQTRKSNRLNGMSVLTPTADVVGPPRHVRVVPKGDIGVRNVGQQSGLTARAGGLRVRAHFALDVASKIFFVACLGSHAQHHGLVGLHARLIDQRIGTHQQATCLLRVLRTALRQIRLSGDQARMALGQAICLAARYANRLRGNLTGAPWIACARKIVGLECQYSGLELQACPPAAGCVQGLLEEAVGSRLPMAPPTSRFCKMNSRGGPPRS